MKRIFLTLSLAFALPAVALAQAAPPPNGPPPMRAEFKQIRAEHQQFRTQVLGALTPANKQLLATVVGNLATADKPDFKGAVQQLDAALSPAEKSTILAAAKSFHDQMKAQMAQFRAAHPRPQMSGSPRPRPSFSPRAKHAPDAGAILLMVATNRGGGMHHGPGMGGPHKR